MHRTSRYRATAKAAAAAALAFSTPSPSWAAAPPQLGPVIEERLPPTTSEAWLRACSLRHPLCVHAAPGTRPAFALAALAAADRAWEVVTGALAAPAPDRSLDGAWHVYLVDAPEGGGSGEGAFLEARDLASRFDRGSSFALVDRATKPGCPLDLALARAVVRGSALRAAPATDPGSAIAETEALASLATPCAGPSVDAATFQAHPERTPVDPISAFARGASLFFGWLDTRFGGGPGLLIEGLWALSPTRATEAWRWPRTPTGFDVLRVSLRDRLFAGSTFDDAVVRFAVDRASMTPAPRTGWHIAWPAQPRRLLAPEPLAPLGASYVLVDVPAGASPTTHLRLEAEWEDYARMRWVVVKLDARGRPIAEMPVGSLDRATHATLTVEQLEATGRLLVVGVNLGDTEGPFDPTAGEWEPHGWMLTLAAE